jgi:hypothetical protein
VSADLVAAKITSDEAKKRLPKRQEKRLKICALQKRLAGIARCVFEELVKRRGSRADPSDLIPASRISGSDPACNEIAPLLRTG